MFIDEVLFSVAVKNDDIAVEASYGTLKLETVCKEDSNGSSVFSALVKEYIL